jgi:hypothetical protein
VKTNIHCVACFIQFLECKILQTKIVEKIKTHFMFNNFFQKLCVYGMWKNTVEPGRPQTTIWPLHIACWIPHVYKYTLQYTILLDFPLKQQLHECAPLLHCTCIARLLVCMEAWNRKPMQKIQVSWGCADRSLECYSRNHTRGTLSVLQNLYVNNVQ